MIRFLFLLFLIPLSFVVNAHTHSFSGVVKLNSGKPLTDATVVIHPLNKHAFTDENGQFHFPKIKGGKYRLEIISIEIGKQAFAIEVGASSKLETFIVQPSSIDLEEVVVSAQSKKKEIETKGFAVNVIETQKIAVQSVQTNELLDRVAGVRVRQDGGMGSAINYSINGLSGNAIKVFIDGIPAANYGSSFSLSSIPPALIERIEVYKGVVPGYLSEDALGGAINVVLKQQGRKSLITSYSFGSFNTHQWNATGSYRWKNGLTFDGSAFYNYSDNDYKVWGKDIFFTENITDEIYGKTARRFHDAYESLGGKFNFGFTNVKWADRFLIGSTLSKDYKEIQHGKTMRSVYGNRHYRRKANILSLHYSKQDLFTEGLAFKLDAIHSYRNRQVIDTIGVKYDWAGPIVGAQASAAEQGNEKSMAINREYTNAIRANLDYRINDLHSIYTSYLFNDFERKVADELQAEPIQRLTNTRDLQKTIVSVAYENRAFSQRLKSSVFYKYYAQKVTSNEPEKLDKKEYIVKHIIKDIDYSGYGLTLSFALRPNLYLLGSIERAIRLPSENEMFGNNAQNVLSSMELEPEKSINANLGFNFGAYTFGLHSLSLNAFVYYRNTTDMIQETFGTSGSSSHEVSQFKNLEDILTKGVDVELTYAYADRFNARISASKFSILSNMKEVEGLPNKHYREQIPHEPSFKMNVHLNYYHKNLFRKGSLTNLYGNFNYVEKFLRFWPDAGTQNLAEVPVQAPIDLGLSYGFPCKRITLSLDAKNILNKQIFDNYGLQKPGRSFYAKITYSIF